MDVLYICTGNRYRSKIAEALTRRDFPGLDVSSAGTDPNPDIPTLTYSLLDQENALHLLDEDVHEIDQQLLDEADHIVVMQTHHLDYLVNNYDIDPADIAVWQIEDTPPEEPVNVLQAIKQRVRRMAERETDE